MTNDQAQGAADTDAPPEFKLPTLPSVPRPPTTPRSSEPLPPVPVLSLDTAPAGRSTTTLSFQEMLRTQQEQANAVRRRRRRSSPVATALVMVIVGGALAAGGYLGYREYRAANEIDSRLPSFTAIDLPYESYTVRLQAVERADASSDLDAAMGDDTAGATSGAAPDQTTTILQITGGRGSNSFEITGSISNPSAPINDRTFSGISDKRGLFFAAPDGTWQLYTNPGAASYETISTLGQLFVWDDLVPEEMRPHVEVRSTSTDTTEQGELTTYELVVQLDEFAEAEPAAYERWSDDTGLGEEDPADLLRVGYDVTITIDDDGLVWSWSSESAGSISSVLEDVSTELFSPTIPATFVEVADQL